MTDAKPRDDLDHRIDTLLRARFALPADLDSLAERVRPARRSLRLPFLFLAAAAALLVALFLAGRPETDPRTTPRSSPGHAPLAWRGTLEADALFCRLIGPLVDGEPQAGRMLSPDLARLWRDMDACQQGSSDAACGTSDFLGERISESYGQPIELRPEAAGLLHGPFGSDEWPTATIVTGTTDEVTSVLIADLATTLDCCVQPRLPEGSGLRLFTVRVGGVVFSEITPFAEPRLLQFFE